MYIPATFFKHYSSKLWICSFTGALMLLGLTVQAQQPATFTQHMENLTPVNPAYSLYGNDKGRVYSSVRKQWLGINGAPTTYLLNGNVVFPNGSAAGLMVSYDKLAVEHSTELNLFFAKSISINEDQHLAVSLNAGVRQYVAMYSSLDPNDPVTKNDINEFRPNLGFGIMWYSENYYLGLSVPQLTIRSLGTASQQAATDFRSTYYFMSGVTLNPDGDIKFKPSALVAYTKGLPLTAYITGMLYAKDTFGFGASYHTNSEAAAIVSFDINGFHIGYSYQFGVNTNTIGGFGNATHEVLLGYRFGKGDKN